MSEPLGAPARWSAAIFPIALAPPALVLALLAPAALDPLDPLASAPPGILFLLFLTAISPAATVFTARRAIRDSRERNRVLAMGGALGFAATIAAAAVAIVLARPLLVRGGGAWLLLASAAVATTFLASTVALSPLSMFRWGLLAGEAMVAAGIAWMLGHPRAPDEYLRYATTVQPGWGATSLGALTARGIRAARTPQSDLATELRSRAIEGTLAAMIENGSFAPPYVEWGDDARVVRAFMASIAASSPLMKSEQEAKYWRTAIEECLVFAESPKAQLEPFLRRSVLSKRAMIETEGLGGDLHLRMRVHMAWNALEMLVTTVENRELETHAVATIRRIFADHALDRTHPIHLLTYSIERRRLVEAGDAIAFMAFFDRLAADPAFPEDLRKQFAREAELVRTNADDGYAPVVQLLRARLLADGGYGDLEKAEAAYKQILAAWPASNVAALARAELQALEPPPGP